MLKDARDSRIDIIRGYAMFTIALYHFNYMFDIRGVDDQKLPQLGDYGFSTAAEIFFLMSGYMVGYIYLRRPDIVVKTLKRAWTIYVVNFLTFICAIAIAWQSGDRLIEFTGAYRTLNDPLSGTVKFLLFQQHPYLLEVLQMYVMFLAVTPIMAAILNRSRWALLALSIAVYLYVQFYNPLHVLLGDPDAQLGAWSFHPLAWQLPYCLGMICGREKLHVRWFDWIGGSIWRPIGLIALFLLTVVAHRLHVWHVITVPATDKSTLGIIRLLHSLIVLGLLTSFLSLLQAHLQRLPFRLIAALGSHTLHCFAASIVLTYAFTAFWFAHGTVQWLYWPLLAALMAALVAVAYVREVDAPKKPILINRNAATAQVNGARS